MALNINIVEEKRKLKRISVTALCKEVGINRTTYYKYLKEPSSMRIDTFFKIADYLGLTVRDKKNCLGS